jgi:hypothetical protein
LRVYVKCQRFAFVVVVKREAKGEYLPVPVMAGSSPGMTTCYFISDSRAA